MPLTNSMAEPKSSSLSLLLSEPCLRTGPALQRLPFPSPHPSATSSLPLLAASLLSEEPVVLENVPRLADVVTIRALLEGRYNVSFEDIRRVYLPALRHRIILNFEAQAENISSDAGP